MADNNNDDARSITSTGSRRSSRLASSTAAARTPSPGGSVTSTGSRRSSRIASKRKRRTSGSSIGDVSNNALSATPRPPPIPEEPSEDRAKRPKKEETKEEKEAEKDVEMKAKAENGEEDNSTLGGDQDMVDPPNVATLTGSDTIPTVVHTPQPNKAVESTGGAPPPAPEDAKLSTNPEAANQPAPAASLAPATPVAAKAPAVAPIAGVLPGAPKTPTAPSLYQQHRQQPLVGAAASTSAAAVPPRSEKKINLQVSGFTPFKQQQRPPTPEPTNPPPPAVAPTATAADVPNQQPPPRLEVNHNPDEPLVQEEEDDEGAAVGVAGNWGERMRLLLQDGEVWMILHESADRVKNYLHRDPYLDDDGREVIPSVMDDWTFTFFLLILLQLALYLVRGSSPMFFETVHGVTRSVAYVPASPKDLYPRLQELRIELEDLHNEEKQSIRLVKKLSNDVQTMLSTHEASVTEQLTTYATATNHRMQLDFDSLWPIEQCAGDLPSMTNEFLTKIGKIGKADRQLALSMTEPEVRTLVRSQLPNDTSSDAGLSPFLKQLDNTIAERFEQHGADTDRAHIGRGATLVYAKTQPVVPQLGNQLGMALGLLPSYGGATAALTADDTCWAIRSYGELVIEFPAPLYVEAIALEQRNPEALVRAFRISGYPVGAAPPLRLGSFEFKRRHSETLQLFAIPDRSQQTPVPPLQRIRLQIDSLWEEPFACLHRFRVYGEEEASPSMDAVEDEDVDGYYD